ncbi:hypothetical protein BRC60_06770 [Halobacteriales archaeon QH_1_68_42]|jgi:uncharacterized membrane protein YjjP (DUF1212 family)|nr:MAG: hypothetical protein BRC60_06770 [Halobacteriales archaeon QH_1_68_42]
MYAGELTVAQERAIDDILTAMKQYDTTREYFRVQYLQTQFIRFTFWILLTGLPALLVAHYASGTIGTGVLPGTTLGVANLLWFESATFAFTMLPVTVITSFVARIVALALTSVFPGPLTLSASEE